jgi:hypothetical protein
MFTFYFIFSPRSGNDDFLIRFNINLPIAPKYFSTWLLPLKFKLNLYCNRRSVGQSVLVSDPHLWPTTKCLLLSDICALHVVGRPLWREDGSVIYSYNLLSLSGPSPAELMTTFYCLIWDSPNLEGQVPVFISPRNRGAQLYPRAIGFPSRRLLRLAGLQWRYCNPTAYARVTQSLIHCTPPSVPLLWVWWFLPSGFLTKIAFRLWKNLCDFTSIDLLAAMIISSWDSVMGQFFQRSKVQFSKMWLET